MKYKINILKSFSYIILIFAIIVLSKFAKAQTIDTLANQQYMNTIHSPRKATISSVILPGLGQAYNKKYWKIPVIYAGFGALIYAANFNNTEYKRFRKAYIALTDDDETTIDEFQGTRSSDEILFFTTEYRRSRDLSFIGMFALYVLNIVDASVDGYFYSFDVSEDISLNLQPKMLNIAYIENAPGISLTLKFYH